MPLDNKEKRNSINEMAVGGHGVGARHDQTASPAGQGGYQEICTGQKFQKKIAQREDLRIRELSEIGLAAHWLEVADAIGVDSFLAMWKILSNSDSVQDNKHYVYVPRFAIWRRYQRNRVIISLCNDGLDVRAIQGKIKSDLDEPVCTVHIKRIIDKFRSKQSA